MRIRLFFRWYDLWVGAYWSRGERALYVCPLPTIGLRIEFPSECGICGVRGGHAEVCAYGGTRGWRTS